MIDGLNPQRSQNIVTNGLAYNLDHHIDTNFSLRPYTPDYIYEEPAWAQLVDYFEEVLGSRFNIIKQLNQFNTIYDDINLETARKYGVPLEWINSNYIADNILKNKEQIKNFHGGIRKFNNQFKAIKAVDIVLKPRINDNVILLAAFK